AVKAHRKENRALLGAAYLCHRCVGQGSRRYHLGPHHGASRPADAESSLRARWVEKRSLEGGYGEGDQLELAKADKAASNGGLYLSHSLTGQLRQPCLLTQPVDDLMVLLLRQG